jgi:hypothetical protein
MGRACSTHGMRNANTFFYSKNLKQREHMRDVDVDGKVIGGF